MKSSQNQNEFTNEQRAHAGAQAKLLAKKANVALAMTAVLGVGSGIEFANGEYVPGVAAGAGAAIAASEARRKNHESYEKFQESMGRTVTDSQTSPTAINLPNIPELPIIGAQPKK